ncbi:MAG: HAMP domain-containing sensor histidine kinase [Erythrobacter sp.]|uniref:sensor histidine kinase n=1 Tax=Erythrobacter sp. TaxID=1042 RepID=UPI00261D8EE3|nr:HAMP domain-containing sensor histidine kinase [Erythrobacter sp.]MDJ0978270.1 HAMP domain-containing sensor histidine kinase [Erythrobacter sp.]
MKRFLPNSLLGQVTLVLALALLVAQAVSAVALYRAAQQRRDAAAVNSIALRLIAETAGSYSARPDRSAGPASRGRQPMRRDAPRSLEQLATGGMPFPPGGTDPPPLSEVRRGGGLPFTRLMRLSLQRSPDAPVETGAPRITRFETALRDLLDEQDVPTDAIRIVRRFAGDDPYVSRIIAEVDLPPFRNWDKRALLVAAIKPTDAPGWLTVRMPEPKSETEGLPLILLQTLVIFIVLMVPLYLVLRRLTQPLAQLTERLDDFSKTPEQTVELEETGPVDTRRLIAAHNKMEARVAALLDEKDVMLGAIGHDLKTPLAALRVRVESVPDEAQRARMADSIEDITRTLDDILSLARVGRAGEGADAPEAVDIRALADSVVEEFEDLGEPVTLDVPIGPTPRVVAAVQVTWLKRALRNLVSNAVRYGGSARVRVGQDIGKGGPMVTLSVEDKGPGIAEGRIADMLEPFTRGETSRNRSTGGAGLGLTLARAIAEAHDGTLVLRNRRVGGSVAGLVAELRIPV